MLLKFVDKSAQKSSIVSTTASIEKKSMKKRIGIFGGSFDPPHFGHLHLATSMMHMCGLDEVWFCPTAGNPLKTGRALVSIDDRLQMLKAAIADEKRFKIIDIEAKKKPPCYTVDTLRDLHKTNEMAHLEFFFILGDDVVANFHLWKEPDAIIDLATIVVGTRDAKPFFFNQKLSEKVMQSLKKGVVNISLVPISSTDVRYRLAKGLSCQSLVPSKVLDYITSHHLYL